MLAALIIVFREVFEAGLIIGIVLAVTRGVPHRDRWIGGGVLTGVAGACLLAVFAGAVSQLFAGMGQELFNAAILGIAVVMLTWHNVWMARHGRELAADLRATGQAVVEGSKSLLALAIVVGVAVLREGSEVVLFLYGVLASEGGSGWSVALGGFLGLVLGAAVCLSTYFGLVKIPARALFATTTVLIALLAAGMASQATAFLEQANWLTALPDVVWDSGWLLSDASVLGRALHTLIGYTDQPTGMQLTVYLTILIATFVLMRLSRMPARTQFS
jgi:high-affinity iron transporter